MEMTMLLAAAKKAMMRAYAPYSGFFVGAALLCGDGTVITGCNIENATYGATNCAERTALFQAVSQGRRDFRAMAIVGGQQGEIRDFCPPCGICRQVMAEFCPGDFRVILTNGAGEIRQMTLDELLPWQFSAASME